MERVGFFLLIFFAGSIGRAFLFKSVLIAESEGNCCIISTCQRTWM